jgi:NAD(P)-dependent dehydrogenase (short-subunit alcohol dehydrogenase family)
MSEATGSRSLSGKVALVAGATRGAGRAIAVELGRAGAFVYATGRSSRVAGRSEIDRPETIEETSELITAAGGEGAAPASEFNKAFREGVGFYYDLVKAAVERIVIGLTAELTGTPCTALAVTPGWLRSERMLENFGVTAATWREALLDRPHFCSSESPTYVGRGIAALAADPDSRALRRPSRIECRAGPNIRCHRHRRHSA